MANKLISQLTAGSANLQDTDQIEGQKNGELITKRFTGLQMRAVEKAEREAQDNVIEASGGLNADGTITAPANSWHLRAADFAAGCTDRSGATGALTVNLLNGLRLLDALVYDLGNGSVVLAYLGVNSDTTYAGVIPAGYMLEYVIFEEKSGASPILDLGTSVGGNEVFLNQELASSDLTTIVLQQVYSLTTNTTLYLNDDDAGSTWDSSTVDLYFVIKPITAGGAVAGVSGTVTIGYYAGNYAWPGVPTSADIVGVIGLATGYAAGTTFFINDIAFPQIFMVISDGTSWYVITSPFVPAL